jgi:hypothetical protein
MHFHPILLVQADSLEDAKIIASDFCDAESGGHSLFDYGGVVPDEETQWNKPLSEVRDKLPDDNYLAEAGRLFNQARDALAQKNYGMAGYCCRKAGELFSQCFSTEYPVFNIQFYDYSRDCGEGWYAIEADLHF